MNLISPITVHRNKTTPKGEQDTEATWIESQIYAIVQHVQAYIEFGESNMHCH